MRKTLTSSQKTVYLCITLCLFSLLPINSFAFSKGEIACFEKADDKNFTPNVLPDRFKVYRGLRGAKNWDDLVKRVRPSRKVFQVVLAPKLSDEKNQANWGNLGWARQNICLVNTLDKVPNCFLLGKGVETFEIGDLEGDILDFILDDHWRYVFENLCVRRTRYCKRVRRQGGVCVGSFNERQFVPGIVE